jgi:hypothetical protein
MLGRNCHSKCAWGRCRYCQDGCEVRRRKRAEQRQVAAEVAEVLGEDPEDSRSLLSEIRRDATHDS